MILETVPLPAPEVGAFPKIWPHQWPVALALDRLFALAGGLLPRGYAKAFERW